jgi:uncharacterized membrane-anchored protein YitT (DUF2179 family)
MNKQTNYDKFLEQNPEPEHKSGWIGTLIVGILIGIGISALFFYFAKSSDDGFGHIGKIFSTREVKSTTQNMTIYCQSRTKDGVLLSFNYSILYTDTIENHRILDGAIKTLVSHTNYVILSEYNLADFILLRNIVFSKINTVVQAEFERVTDNSAFLISFTVLNVPDIVEQCNKVLDQVDIAKVDRQMHKMQLDSQIVRNMRIKKMEALYELEKSKKDVDITKLKLDIAVMKRDSVYRANAIKAELDRNIAAQLKYQKQADSIAAQIHNKALLEFHKSDSATEAKCDSMRAKSDYPIF